MQFVKHTVKGLLIALIILICVELTLRMLGIGEIEEQVSIKSKFNPDIGVLNLPAIYADKIPVSVWHNVVSNELTYPDNEFIFRVKPNPDNKVIMGYSGINSMGFRGEEFDLDKDRKSILIIGNSCAFGWNIKAFKNTIASQLNKSIKELHDAYSVINLAQPGYSTTQSLKLLQKWAPRIQPDILIIYTGWNDLWETPMLTDHQTLRLLSMNKFKLIQLVKKTHVYRSLRSLFILTGMADQYPIQLDAELGRKPRVPIEESVANIMAMAKMAPIALYVKPPYCCNNRLKPMELYFKLAYAPLQEHVHLVEFDSMNVYNPLAHMYFQEDGFHPNEKGAKYMATLLYDHIRTIVTDP